MDCKALRERWASESGRELARQVIECLLRGRSLEGLAVGVHEGRVDLRGLPASDSHMVDYFMTERGWFVEQLGGLVEFRGRRLEGLDLSGARLEHVRFFDSELVDCRIDGAACRDWRMWNTRVLRCSFVGADMQQGALGTWHEGRRNEWLYVNLRAADLRHAHARGALFEDCDFSRAELEHFVFMECTLRRTRFAGLLSNVLLDGRPLSDAPAPSMTDVDLSEARLSEVEFMGWPSLSGVILPDDPDVWLVRRFRCVAERGRELLAGDTSIEARQILGILESRLKAMRTEDEENIFNRRDWATGDGLLLALAESTISRAAAECGASQPGM